MLAPLFPHPVSDEAQNDGSLLVVGMNPSFGPDQWFNRRDVREIVGGNPTEFFLWDRLPGREARQEAVRQHDQLALTLHPYFNRPKELATEVELPFAHLDVFAYRKTEQGRLFSALNRDPQHKKFRGIEHLSDFACDQIEIFCEAVPLYNPRAIVVGNAAASKIVEAVQGQDTYCEMTGCHYWIRGTEQPIPMLFSGILSGARALDTGSFRRLKWHLRQVLDV